MEVSNGRHIILYIFYSNTVKTISFELLPVIAIIIGIKASNKFKNKKNSHILQELMTYEPSFNKDKFDERAKESFYALCEAKSNCDMEQLTIGDK